MLTTKSQEVVNIKPRNLNFYLLGLLFFSLIFNVYLLVNPHKQTPREPDNSAQYSLLSPHLSTINKEDRIMHFAPLKNDITSYIDQKKDIKTSIYFEYLVTGANFSINVDLYTYPGSLTKVPISMMIMDKVQKGELNLDQKFTISQENKDSLSGDLYKLPDGTQMTLKELLENNLVKSDNTAKNILYKQINPDNINVLIDELGMEKLFDSVGNTTAKEYARVFRSLYYASMLTKDDSNYILDLLTKTDRERFMPIKLPTDIVVAHKYASMKPERSFSDVGIVYVKNRPFLIAITIDGRESKTFDDAQAREFIGTITKKAFDYINR